MTFIIATSRWRSRAQRNPLSSNKIMHPSENVEIDLKMDSPKRKRILIVGAGAAGTAAAYSLSKCPDMFEVEVWEKRDVAGGVACSSDISKSLFVNYGVQGGTPTYRNTLNLMNEFGFQTNPVHMMISFGKGRTAWTNYNKSDLTKTLQKEIARFEKTLKLINKLEVIFIFLPIAKVLKWFGYSENFCNLMVFPLTALFFGTGNQTPYVSAAIMARVFLDNDLRLFDYDPESLLSQTPEMFAFPKLEQMYETIIQKCGVKFYPNRPVGKVRRSADKINTSAKVTDVHSHRYVKVTDASGQVESFDEIIFACDAETALKVLENPRYMEKKALGNVRYFNDLIVTHEDENYMNKNYELHVEKDQYFVRTDPEDPKKIEMSFNLSNYQPQLKKSGRNIYQTIFLDDKLKDIWTVDDIKENKVLIRRWWRQFAHSWHHYAFSVPLMRYIQGGQHTWYCGAYTLINTHEIAMISGLAAAHRLGAPYPFSKDELATKQFDQYLQVIHGQSRTPGCNKNNVLSYLMAPFMAIFAFLALIVRFFYSLCN